MTAIKTGDIARFLKSRPQGTHVALFHGPDQGLVRERAAQLSKHVVDDPNDPFNAVELGEADITSTGQLADEAAALSFMGGERLIRVRGSGDHVTKAVKHLLKALESDELTPNALVVIEAGELKKTSALRKACEASRTAAAIACYAEDGQDLLDTLRSALKAEALDIEEEALMALASRLGEDRGITRSELEKLILYKGTKAQRGEAATVSTEDIREALAESTSDATFEIIDLALGGETSRLSEALYRARGAGVSPLAILRILQNKLLRLQTVQEAVDRGTAREAAIKSLRPPVFFGEQRSFSRALTSWPLPRLRQAVRDVYMTDLDSKRTGMPQAELVERALLRLSMMAGRSRS
ncbi:DNA polymerase III subunit delta [Parvularcula marina]|uniref:DNA polymerase III subunit delta n=1 Tax=Parvularcula marina TaxID=2292771 RepID=UPI003511429A